MFGRIYVILYFDPFCVCSMFDPSQTSLNGILPLAIITRISLEIELFTALNYFAGAVKTQKLMGALFLFESVAMVSSVAPILKIADIPIYRYWQISADTDNHPIFN